MKEIFVDTAHWIAHLNPRDGLHQQAIAQMKGLGPVHFVTSEFVLLQLLNGFSSSGPNLRRTAGELVTLLQKRADVTVVAGTSALFRAGLQLYTGRADKAWGLTDCTSFLIMRSRGIPAALTHNHHFEQAGFVALLRG